ncbi:hypothetical protein Tco_0333064 [Tanacetum coccineum]
MPRRQLASCITSLRVAGVRGGSGVSVVRCLGWCLSVLVCSGSDLCTLRERERSFGFVGSLRQSGIAAIRHVTNMCRVTDGDDLFSIGDKRAWTELGSECPSLGVRLASGRAVGLMRAIVLGGWMKNVAAV